MDLVTIGTIGAGVLGLTSALGQHRANVMQRDLALKQMGFSAKEAGRQRRFQAKMVGSAWTRGMADMRAAGLNPMLAFMQGPAATPSGAMGSASGGISPGNVAEAGISSVMEMRRQNQELRNMFQEECYTANQTAKAAAETQESHKRQDLLELQKELMRWQILSAKFVADLDMLCIPEMKAMSKMWERLGEGGSMGWTFLPMLIQLLRSR